MGLLILVHKHTIIMFDINIMFWVLAHKSCSDVLRFNLQVEQTSFVSPSSVLNKGTLKTITIQMLFFYLK